jgi:hypothetical protein
MTDSITSGEIRTKSPEKKKSRKPTSTLIDPVPLRASRGCIYAGEFAELFKLMFDIRQIPPSGNSG